MSPSTALPRTSDGIRDGRLVPPPEFTTLDLDVWRARLRADGHDVVPVGGALRYAGQADSPPLLLWADVLAEMVDEWNPDTGEARIGAEADGLWFCVMGGDATLDGLVYLTWLHRDGAWHLAPSTQYEA